MRRMLVGLAGTMVLAAGCGEPPPPPTAEANTRAADATQLANPAATHCVKVGGRLTIEKHPSGDEFGVCLFEDNRQCEEWAMLRGDCPVGGRRITGYPTAAGRYCAITGGTYTVVSDGDGSAERGHCDLPGGKSCDADDYYNGSC